MTYEVFKSEIFTIGNKEYTAPVANYGYYADEADVKLIVRGYKATKQEYNKTIYTRKNSKICYEVYTH